MGTVTSSADRPRRQARLRAPSNALKQKIQYLNNGADVTDYARSLYTRDFSYVKTAIDAKSAFESRNER
jgi:cell division protein FtsB